MKHLLVIAFLILFTQLQAQVRIGTAEACATAERFLPQNDKQDEQTLTLREEIKSKQSEQTNLFVFSIEPQGFIIVSALDEVLAYSFASTLSEKEMLPDPFVYWLDLYNERTDYLMEHPSHARKLSKNQQEVGPLLTSIWGQGCFHNEACPVEVTGPCQHVEAGCVAIAIAQIMYYHKQPQTGNGSLTYNCSPYGTLSANFGNTTYHWENMVDTVSQSNPAVAELIFHCGVSVKMKYSANSSVSSISNAVEALRQFFSYPTSSVSQRDNYSDEEWIAMIREDLDKRHPLYFQGKSNLGTHAFVCDGYDSNGLFHFNFGWDGVADGYYALDAPYGFSLNQSIIHDIYPLDDIAINGDEHGIIYVAPEGTGDGSSWEQATDELQLAIFKAYKNDCSIWVKEGRFKGNPTKSQAFLILNKCRLYGGFKGDENYDYDLSLRDFEAHPTILDGDHVQSVVNVNTNYDNDTILIDGFTIQNGKGSHGGIFLSCHSYIKNCKFLFNYSKSYGGGLSQHYPTHSRRIVVENCEFIGNEAKLHGGAVYDNGNTLYKNCLFCDNLSYKDGGGIYCYPFGIISQFINCTISNNTAKNGGGIATTNQGAIFWSCLINNNTAETGGGCYLEYGAKLFNCTIVKNEAETDYGGVYISPLSPKENIRNCIVWGNINSGENTQIGPGNYLYCAVDGDQSGKDYNYVAEADNDGSLPRFYVRFRNADVDAGVTEQEGDWRLQSNSLCIDRAESIDDQPETDLEGNPRHRHNNVDLGAYESDVATQDIIAYYCENEPYYYQDSLLSALGLYTFLYQNYSYDSLVIVQMETPLPSVFLTEEICENETYEFHGMLLNSPGVYTVTEQCITYNLTLKLKPLTTVSMQEEICEGESFDFFGELLHETGHYSTSKDCKTYELDLTVSPNSDVPVYMEEQICEGETYDFFGRSLRYGGHYSTNVNCTHHELDLIVNPRPTLHCSNDTIVEYGNSVQLTVSGADSYLWSTGDTTDRITVFPKKDETYFVTGFSNFGCRSTANIKVTINLSGDEIVIYPNPANDKVEIYATLIDEVEVFNLIGEPIERIETTREAVTLDVSHYANGVYIIHVKQLNKHSYKKLVIRH